MKRLFELADLLGLFLDQAADNWMSISERSNGEQPYGLLGEGCGVPAHKGRGPMRTRIVLEQVLPLCRALVERVTLKAFARLADFRIL